MIILAYGLPGTGKSTLLHDLVAAHTVKGSVWRFFCVDHEQGWGPDARFWRGKPPPVTLIDGPEALDSLAETPAEDWPDSGVWVFQRCEAQAVAALALHVGNVTYVDDEIDTAARRQGWEGSPLRRIAHEGRHIVNSANEVCHCHIIGACRRPQNLHTDVADLIDQVYVFRIQGRRTLERLLNDSIFADDEWETVRALPDLHFFHWSKEGTFFDALQPFPKAAKQSTHRTVESAPRPPLTLPE